MLSDRELDRARGDLERLLTATCTRYTLTRVSDGGGGFTDEWTPRGSFPCSVAPIGGGEKVTGSRISDRTTHVLTVPADTGIEEADRLEVDDQTYEVTLVRKRSTELVRRVEAREVQGG